MRELKIPICDSYAMCSFMHIDFNEQQVPDATTLLKFRHILEKYKIGEKIFADVNKRLYDAGLIMHGGTVVDASLIVAPKSTKNQSGKRDPEMHQTQKKKRVVFRYENSCLSRCSNWICAYTYRNFSKYT